MTLTEIATLPEDAGNPMDLWGGFAGQGFDGRLFLSTGSRHGGQSRIYSTLDGRTWTLEFGEEAETLNKIRDHDGALYAFYENPSPGQSWLIRREPDDPIWQFEPVPEEFGVVGGRGIGASYFGDQDLFVGASMNWTGASRGEVYRRDSGYVLHRTVEPSLMWELEWDDLGRLWEFWNAFGAYTPALYVGGVAQTPPPGADISQAAWFPPMGMMYVTGELEGINQNIYRSPDGAAWDISTTFPHATRGDHVLYVPRGAGELWAVGHAPFDVLRTVDGVTWEEVRVPRRYETGEDSNHLTAVGYYRGRVYVASLDVEAGVTRILTESGAPSMLQII